VHNAADSWDISLLIRGSGVGVPNRRQSARNPAITQSALRLGAGAGPVAQQNEKLREEIKDQEASNTNDKRAANQLRQNNPAPPAKNFRKPKFPRHVPAFRSHIITEASLICSMWQLQNPQPVRLAPPRS
jgi:hypothetical protein